MELFVAADGQVPFEAWLATTDDTRRVGRAFAAVSELSRGRFQCCFSLGCGVYAYTLDGAYCLYFALLGADGLIVLAVGKRGELPEDRVRVLKMWEEFRDHAH